MSNCLLFHFWCVKPSSARAHSPSFICELNKKAYTKEERRKNFELFLLRLTHSCLEMLTQTSVWLTTWVNVQVAVKFSIKDRNRVTETPQSRWLTSIVTKYKCDKYQDSFSIRSCSNDYLPCKVTVFALRALSACRVCIIRKYSCILSQVLQLLMNISSTFWQVEFVTFNNLRSSLSQNASFR